MYKLTRQDVSEALGISTRSVDRYIKAGKLRSKKKGKVVYINNNDVENMSTGNSSKQQIIVEKDGKKAKKKDKNIVKENYFNKKEIKGVESFEKIYKGLKHEIEKKDEVIQTLAIRVGRAEEIAKNSISLVEFKKSQFLLEESKGHLNKRVEELELENSNYKRDLKDEKNTNIGLIIFVVILLVMASIFWFKGV